MQKKVLIIAVCLLIFTFLTVACNQKDKTYEQNSTYAPIDYTVGEDGEKYITNIYGDLIPVTTSKDGSMELMEDLITKTKEQASEEQSELDREATQSEPSGTDAPSASESETRKPSGGIQVGTDSIRDHSEKDAVIVW